MLLVNESSSNLSKSVEIKRSQELNFADTFILNPAITIQSISASFLKLYFLSINPERRKK